MGMGMMVVCGTAGRTVVSRSIVIRRRVLSFGCVLSVPSWTSIGIGGGGLRMFKGAPMRRGLRVSPGNGPVVRFVVVPAAIRTT